MKWKDTQHVSDFHSTSFGGLNGTYYNKTYMKMSILVQMGDERTWYDQQQFSNNVAIFNHYFPIYLGLCSDRKYLPELFLLVYI